MENKMYWNKMARPPKDALKQIVAGRLRGMTDINPQWRYEAMTDTFGPVGIGWSWSIVSTWTLEGAKGQVAVFAEVALKYKHDGEWSEPVPGIGGSMFVAAERAGLYTSDEAVKMAVTDALSVAMKTLGVGADIYKGKWDGSKYSTPAPKQEPAKTGRKQPKKQEPATPVEDDILRARKAMFAAMRDAKVDKEDMVNFIALNYGVESSKELKLEDLKKIRRQLVEMPDMFRGKK